MGESLQVAKGSTVNIQNATTNRSGGGFVTLGGVVVASESNITIDSGTASEDGGGFKCLSLRVANRSAIFVRNATAQSGGGFLAGGEVTVTMKSSAAISDSRALW